MGEVNVKFTNGKQSFYKKGTTLLQISQERSNSCAARIMAAKVNNEIKDLHTIIEEDCDVHFLDVCSAEGLKIYQRTLIFILITAVQELFPQGELTVEHSLSKGLYCELHLNRELTEQDIAALEGHMRQIIAEDRQIEKKTLPTQDAIALFSSVRHQEKAKLLKQYKKEAVSIYYCGGVYDYLYGNMAPSTGYISVFGLRFYKPGFILQFPELGNPDKLPDFVEQPKLAEIFLEAEKWGEILRCGYVATLNDYVDLKKIDDIIRVAEALHEKKIAQIADFVAEHRNKVRVILVAGPSSSGKTTFAQRLGIQLRVNGLRPVPISLDDYFVNRECTPRDEKGDYDFEAIEAIDLKLFNHHLIQLLDGEKLEIPSYDFMTGQRVYRGQKIHIERDQPLIIEGIHGLNERLTRAVPRDQKVKIYISALTQLSIDNHNRIPTTDTRLIRRIVRDSQFRNHTALRTLQLWPAVRRGEEKNIFPFQEEADIMFNSALIYELGVLKKYAEPLLQQVTAEYPQFVEAKRLLNFLAHFTSIGDNEIPTNSILREFIGNSCFRQTE